MSQPDNILAILASKMKTVIQNLSDTPQIMGVLNITPDSFSDGGQYNTVAGSYARAEQMLNEGVDIFDIGGESTRPGAQAVSIQEELDRILPVIEAIKPLGKSISVDTRRTQVMQAVLELGVNIINDVNALQESQALETVAKTNADICLMHMQGQPKTMQEQPAYSDVVNEVVQFLQARIDACQARGIDASRIIIDPGFGFGKTLAHNLQLLSNLKQFKQLGCRILIGLSRKSMFGHITGKPVEDRFASSLAATVVGLLQGVDIVRTHDVAGTLDAIQVLSALKKEA